jgi:uncharacterized protein YqeY
VQEQIERDLKAAMLSGDKAKTEVLKGLKSALQYEAVNLKSENRTLNDDQAQKVVAREAKKRQETAEIYKKAGEDDRAAKEMVEKEIIDVYLPEQLSEEEIDKVVEEEITKSGAAEMSDMGRIIGAVRGRLGSSADGSIIAKLVKEKLSK